MASSPAVAPVRWVSHSHVLIGEVPPPRQTPTSRLFVVGPELAFALSRNEPNLLQRHLRRCPIRDREISKEQSDIVEGRSWESLLGGDVWLTVSLSELSGKDAPSSCALGSTGPSCCDMASDHKSWSVPLFGGSRRREEKAVRYCSRGQRGAIELTGR